MHVSSDGRSRSCAYVSYGRCQSHHLAIAGDGFSETVIDVDERLVTRKRFDIEASDDEPSMLGSLPQLDQHGETDHGTYCPDDAFGVCAREVGTGSET
jgi:hypothetical protein